MTRPEDRQQEDLPEELLDYEEDLHLVDLSREDHLDDGEDDEEPDAWLQAQQRARKLRRTRGHRRDNGDWVNEAFEAFLSMRGQADYSSRRRR